MNTVIKNLFLFIASLLALSAAHAQDSTQHADPDIAIRRTMILEGGYVHATRAHGGQIYRGITRVSHPKWEGWKIVDQHKLKREDTLAELDELAADFYKTHYWDHIRAGELTNQQTANSYFNTSVKLGLDRSIMKAQRSVGLAPTGIVDDALIARLNSRGYRLSSAKKSKASHRSKMHNTSHGTHHKHNHSKHK